VKIAALRNKRIVILGLGLEGRSTWRCLRAAFPEKTLGLADRLSLKDLPPETVQLIDRDPSLSLHLGDGYLSSLAEYEVIVKSPGIPLTLPGYRQAVAAGIEITSQTALFFSNFPGRIIGVTGTKGKSTTASLLHSILKRPFPDAGLVGNIGVPPLDALGDTEEKGETRQIFVYELSSHQLEGLRQSPQIAVLLNVVPEHLDYYESFEQYVAAKENITRFQSALDFLIYDSDHDLPRQIASRSQAQRIACSLIEPRKPGCFLSGDSLIYRAASGKEEQVVAVSDIRLPGKFNLMNVAAAVAAARAAGVPVTEMAEAIRGFQPLAHRLERVGTYGGVTYYDDSIATVPEATIAALDTLGDDVETILLGGTDRGLNFSSLAERLLRSGIKTVILFPPSGERIWKTFCEQAIRERHESRANSRFRRGHQNFFVKTMEEAVALAKRETAKGKICLHSPASPSFGLFRDYRERGDAFQRLVREGG
jgi:UDP-N-acetylmuramoylalanine--D-glutamate ligase